jgi:predicted RNase H-like HicB family nuclease
MGLERPGGFGVRHDGAGRCQENSHGPGGIGPLVAFVVSVVCRPQLSIAGGIQEVSIERKCLMKLVIRIKQQLNGSYRAYCPSLPGCCVCGQTKEDAYSKINLAVRGYLASLDVCLPRELNRALTMEMKQWPQIVALRPVLQATGA